MDLSIDNVLRRHVSVHVNIDPSTHCWISSISLWTYVIDRVFSWCFYLVFNLFYFNKLFIKLLVFEHEQVWILLISYYFWRFASAFFMIDFCDRLL